MSVTFNTRHKVPDLKLCSFKMPVPMVSELNAHSMKTGTSKSELVRIALRELFEKHKASSGQQGQEEEVAV